MKINFLLITIMTVVITSCSSSYKTGQTPDDVYYSPARLQTDNVRREDNKNIQDNSVYSTPEDRYIRRRVHSRRYRNYDDGYNYPYGYNNGYNNGYPVYINPKIKSLQNNSLPRKTNLDAYNKNSTTDSANAYNPKLGNFNHPSTTNPVRTFGTQNNSSNNGSGVGNFIRRVFSGDNNSNYNNSNYNNNSNNSSPTRSFERSNNNSNNSNNSETKSSPTTNSTSAPVRTFKKDD